jgi:hypothetical protein
MRILWIPIICLTKSKERFALYTPSILLNIMSRSGGGRFDRDHAAAIFCKKGEGFETHTKVFVQRDNVHG